MPDDDAPIPSSTTHRPALCAAACVLASVSLCACTAQMDMTLSPDGTYDVVLDLRDSTNTVFTPDTDCSSYADPALVGVPSSGSIHAEPVGPTDDDASVGCRITIRGIPVSQAHTPSPETTHDAVSEDDSTTQAITPSSSQDLVVRDGDLYRVDLTPLASSFLPADDGDSKISSGTYASLAPESETSADSAASPAASNALESVIDARASVTFPGAVVDAGGGQVEGTTVTWNGAVVLSEGVSASGYATPHAGLSWWQKHRVALIGVVVTAGAALGCGAWWRRHRH